MGEQLRQSGLAMLAAGLASVTMAASGEHRTISTVTEIAAPPALVWSAIRDVYRVHERLVPGLVANTVREGENVRAVTFANGLVVRERIVAVDEARRQIDYAAFGGRASHHRAWMQVEPAPLGSRVTWVTEFAPAELEPFIRGNMEAGVARMKQTLEAEAARGRR